MLRTPPLLLTMTLLLLCPAWSAAQSLSPKEIDARLETQLYDVLKLGTDIYNRGSQDACYRLYQGSLMSIVGFLEHRPDQIIKINKAIKDTNDMINVSERAFTLRKALDDLRAAIKPTLTSQMNTTQPANPPGQKSLWDRLGGELTVTLLVEDLVTRVMKNPRINFARRGTGVQWDANPENLSKLKKHFIFWISSVSGGPFKPTSDLKTVHLKMKISEAEYEAFIIELRASLDKYFISPEAVAELMKQFDSMKKDIVDSTIVVKSLWDRLGGEAMVTLLVDDFVSRVAKDAAVNFSRKNEGREWQGTPAEVTALRKQLVHWVSSVSNGPHKYSGKPMKDAHIGMKISNAQFTALVLDLKASLDLCKVSQAEQDELLGIVSGLRADIVEVK